MHRAGHQADDAAGCFGEQASRPDLVAIERSDHSSGIGQACPFCREPLHAGKVFVAAAFKPVDDVKEEDVGEDIKVDIKLDEQMPPSTKMVKSL